jgi:hypothetical protein
MRITKLTIFIILLLNACKSAAVQRELSGRDSVYLIMSSYMNAPDLIDTLCRKDIAEAKQDVANGKIVMNDLLGFEKGNRRYKEQLQKLAESHGLVFEPEGEYCLIYVGQTQGCYSLYMDKIIAEKYGEDFERLLHHRADSLYFEQVKNDTIWYWKCDKKPKLLPDHTAIEWEIGGGIMFMGIILETEVKVPEVYIESIFPSDKYPTFVKVYITINKNGDVTDYRNDNQSRFDPADAVLYDKLFMIAVEEIKSKYNKWQPGTIAGYPINTKYEFRVYFKNKAS